MKKAERRRSKRNVSEAAASSKANKGSVLTTQSSSSDSDQETTKNIINRLSRKYLNVDKKKRRSKRIAENAVAKETSPYEGDVENNTDENSQTCTNNNNSMEIYDFDQSDEVRLRLDLSPIRADEESPRTRVSSSPRLRCAAKSTTRKTSQKLLRSPRLTLHKVEVNKPSKPKRSPPSNKEDSQQKKKQKASTPLEKIKGPQLARSGSGSGSRAPKQRPLPSVARKTPVAREPPAKLCGTTSRKRKLSSSELLDSGVFMTPPAIGGASSSLASPSDVSTTAPTPSVKTYATRDVILPRLPAVTCKKARRESCFGFDSLLSPVPRVPATGSDLNGQLLTSQTELYNDFSVSYGDETNSGQHDLLSEDEPLPMFKALDISKTYSGLTGIGYYDKPVEKRKRKIRNPTTKKPPKQSLGQYETVAEKMNQEFSEFDDFELSVEG